MARLGLVDQTDLLRWADSREAQGELSRLIRRLILETGLGVVELDFPAGEGIASQGYDGTVRATEATAYVPAGLSLWEVSVEKSVSTKANKDYAKGLATPDGSPPKNCTYVEVLLRRWAKRLEWARGKASEGRWQAVRAYGVDDIETWLESAPVTHAWLSELLGFHPHGVLSAETWWASWSGATTPAFPATAVLAGRDSAADELQAKLGRPGHIVTVQGASRDDVVAFVSALGQRGARSDGGALLARTALVDTIEAWRRLRDHQAPLVLVPRTEEVTADLGESAHYLIVPVVGTGSADITLPSIDSQGAIEALKEAGLPERNAEETGRLARMSLLAARRRIANKPELHRPSWAKAASPRLVRRALLAGRWNESSSADVTVTSNIFGTEYDSLRDELESLMSDHDPLLVRFGSAVGLVSPFDAWLLLGGNLHKADLEAFRAAALVVFGESDPVFELSTEDRWKASILGKVPPHSRDLRQGLATTLALLGSYGNAVVAGSSNTGQEWASWIVREILEAANKDETCRLWASLRDVLTLLAEAAPSRFLEAVRTGLNGESPLLRQMFMDKTDSSAMFSDSAHTNLLWALEICAWSPTDFGQAVDLLARLSEVDPGGRLMNRPAASLGSIFLPSYPQTSASNESRLAALDGLRKRHKAVAWDLMLSMLPCNQSFVMPAIEPRFRDWKLEQIGVAGKEYWAFIDEVCWRLLDDVGVEPSRWSSMVEWLPRLPPQVRSSALEQLGLLSTHEALDEVARGQIWKSLRSQAALHRKFPHADWALPADYVTRLEEIQEGFKPSMSVRQIAWLFDDYEPEITNAQRGAGEYQTALNHLRARAAAEIAESIDWPGLHSFAIGTKLPWIFGTVLAQARIVQHESEIIELLKSDEQADLSFANSYLAQRFHTEGWPWVEELLRRRGLLPVQAGLLLLVTADFPRAWEVAEASGQDVAAVFWRHFRTSGLGHDFPHVETVAQKLLDTGRPGSALDLLARYIREDSQSGRAELMAVSLEELLQYRPEDPEHRVLPRYTLPMALSYLQRASLPAGRLARLEWAYLQAFDHNTIPPTLGQYLAHSPGFFVDILSKLYLPRLQDTIKADETAESASVEPGEAQRQAVAQNAFQLLFKWRTIPGTREDGTIDGDILNQWVNETRRLLRTVHRLEDGDIYIGMVLASSPADPNGTWPCVEVRDLLEAFQSEEMEQGLKVRIRNNRGVTRRGVFDGGAQELDLAEKYNERAKTVADRWPRTAAIFRSLAKDYEREGRYFDETAERRRKGF